MHSHNQERQHFDFQLQLWTTRLGKRVNHPHIKTSKYDMSNIYSVNLLSMESMSMPTKHTYSCLEILLMTARKSLNTCMLRSVGGEGVTGRQGNSYCSNKLECLSSVLNITRADGQAWLTIPALHHANKYTLWMETWASSFPSIITAGRCFSYSHLHKQTHL